MDTSFCFFFFSSRRRHTRLQGDWSSDVCSSDLDGVAPAEQLKLISERVVELMELQRKCFYDVLLPEMEKHGIRLVTMSELTPQEWHRLDQFFESQVFPVLTPLAVDPGHPFPYISNLSLSIAVQVHDPATGTTRLARIKVPKSLPRWVPFGKENHFVPLEQVIGAHLDALFPGMEIRAYSTFRVTRYSDLDLADADEDDDLLAMIEEQIFQRRFAEVVRVEVDRGISRELRDLILAEVLEDQPPEMPTLTESDLVETGPLLDLG